MSYLMFGTVNRPANGQPLDLHHYATTLEVTGNTITFGEPNVHADSNSSTTRSTGYYQPLLHDDNVIISNDHQHLTFAPDASVVRSYTPWHQPIWSYGIGAALPDSVTGNRLLMLDSGYSHNFYKPRLALFSLENGQVGPLLSTLDPQGPGGLQLEPGGDMGFTHQVSATRWLVANLAYPRNTYEYLAIYIWLVDIANDQISIVDVWEGPKNRTYGNGGTNEAFAPWEVIACREWNGEWWLLGDDMNNQNYNAYTLRRISMSGNSIVVGAPNLFAGVGARALVFSPQSFGDDAMVLGSISTSGSTQNTIATRYQKNGDIVTQLNTFSAWDAIRTSGQRDNGAFANEPLPDGRWLIGIVTSSVVFDATSTRLRVGLFEPTGALLDLKTPFPDEPNDGYFHVAGRYVTGDAIVSLPFADLLIPLLRMIQRDDGLRVDTTDIAPRLLQRSSGQVPRAPRVNPNSYW
jgi:hypothetical protein